MSQNLYGEMDFAPAENLECGPGQVEIDQELCDGCVLCSVICPAAILVPSGTKSARKVSRRDGQDNCMACGCCEAICQMGAISIQRSYDFGGPWKQMDRGQLCLPRRF